LNRGWRFCRYRWVVNSDAWLRLLVPDDAWISVLFGCCCSEVAPKSTSAPRPLCRQGWAAGPLGNTKAIPRGVAAQHEDPSPTGIECAPRPARAISSVQPSLRRTAVQAESPRVSAIPSSGTTASSIASLQSDRSELAQALGIVVDPEMGHCGLDRDCERAKPCRPSLLRRFFAGAVHPFYLLAGAAVPTLIAAAVFLLM